MRGARLRDTVGIPTLELFKGIQHRTVSVGTAVTELPPMDYRKGVYIQNKSSTATVYIGGGLPEIYIGRPSEMLGRKHEGALQWKLSGGGTNEWYCVTKANGDPGLTEPTYMYFTAVSGTEAAGTMSTIGSLAAEGQWDWGDSGGGVDDLGFDTIYVRTNGSGAANSPDKRFESLYGYTFTLTANSDATTTGGYLLAPHDGVSLTADGTVRIFAISSAATTGVGILEVI